MFTRRRFIENAALLGTLGAAQAMAPWARSADASSLAQRSLSGTEFDLAVSRGGATIDGRRGGAVLINGRLPAPLLRWREGDEIAIRVRNDLDEDTSIHWHGLLVPANMDGVPGVSFPGIAPGETFAYRFPVRQNGTYWYHSHSGFQEQMGHYGPIVIKPVRDPVAFDREHAIVLSDWTFQAPERVFAALKKEPGRFKFQRRTIRDLFRDAEARGPGDALAERAMWGGMRMDPTDIADVTGALYTYLVNGAGPGDDWTALFSPGERVRLRIINASAMTIFNVRIPGLPMTVVQADGMNVRPVETDEFQIGVAETYDIIVQPKDDRAFTMMAETIDRSGYARATLAPRAGMTAEVPALRPRPVLAMKDMAMDHGGMGGMDHGGTEDQSGHGAHGAHGSASGPQRHDHKKGPGVDMLAERPMNRLADPPTGLEDAGHPVLTYAALASLDPNPDDRAPSREIELHLTGNMARFMWSFDGVKFSDVDAPIALDFGERVRLVLVNDTMMNHPIHLHGMFFDVVTGEGPSKPRKHTITVKPGEKLALDVTADAPGEWAFHCHLLYHMAAGMMQTVLVRGGPKPSAHGEHGGKSEAKPAAHEEKSPDKAPPGHSHDAPAPTPEKPPEHDHHGGRH